MATVVSGILILRAEVPMGKVADMLVPIQTSFAQVAGVQEPMVLVEAGGSSNSTLRPGRTIPMQDFTFAYYILPPEGGSEDVVRAILDSQEGTPIQPFMRNLRIAMLEHQPTSLIVSSSSWSASMPSPTAAMLHIRRPVTQLSWVRTTLRTTSTAPTTTNLLQVLQQCWTVSRACDCAVLPGCSWAEDTGGVMRCLEASETRSSGVACNVCPMQAHCPGSGCGYLSDPCSCLESVEGCRWDEAFNTCVDRASGSTSCASCARQPHCSTPRIEGYTPSSGTTLQMPAHQNIRVLFDRNILLGSGTASFECTGQPRPELIPRQHLQVSGQSLLVNVNSVASVDASAGESRDCWLLLSEGIVTSLSGVAFLGVPDRNAYLFRLGDTVAPHVTQVNPQNGDTRVSVSVVTFTFNEQIFFSPYAATMDAELSSLDSATDGDAVKFAVVPPRVKVDNKELVVDLSGDDLQEGVLYSLSLPEGAVVDSAGNVFEGLPVRTYAFRAGINSDVGDESPMTGLDLNSVTGMAAAAGLGAGALVLCCYVLARFVRLRKTHANYLSGSMTKVRPARVASMRPNQPQPQLQKQQSAAWEASKDAGPRRASWSSEFADDGPRRASWSSEASPHHGAPDAPRSPSSTWGPSSTFGSGTWDSSFLYQTTGSFGGGAKSNGTKPEARRSQSMGPSFGRRSSAPGSGGAGAAASSAGGAAGGGGSGAGATSRGRRSNSMGPTNSGPGLGSGRYSTEGQRSSAGAGSTSSSGQQSSSKTSSQGRQRSASPQRNSYNAGQTGSSRTASKEDRGSRVFMATPELSTEDGEVKKKKLQLERRLRDMMSKPVADRKKVLRELMLEYHPDKNKDPNATEIFQFINASRGWFLADP